MQYDKDQLLTKVQEAVDGFNAAKAEAAAFNTASFQENAGVLAKYYSDGGTPPKVLIKRVVGNADRQERFIQNTSLVSGITVELTAQEVNDVLKLEYRTEELVVLPGPTSQA